jgi:hypothetical protein
MSDKAVAQGTYSDFKIIRGRKVAQIVVEIPIEQAQAFIHAFGIPNAAQETWVALARLQIPAKQETPPGALPEPHRPFPSLPYAQQAALRCNDMAFREFLRSKDHKCDSAEDAAKIVRAYCEVTSRADIRPGTKAEKFWLKLNSHYEFWETARAA